MRHAEVVTTDRVVRALLTRGGYDAPAPGRVQVGHVSSI